MISIMMTTSAVKARHLLPDIWGGSVHALRVLYRRPRLIFIHQRAVTVKLLTLSWA